MRILVTGASGFVGSRLINSGSQRSENVLFRAVARKQILGLNTNTEEILISNIDRHTDWSIALKDVDVVVHLAARVHVMQDRSADPLLDYREANVASTLNLAEHAAKAGVKRFIFLSSIKVNGEKTEPGHPFAEESPPYPEDLYGVSKLEAEEGIRAICKQVGMEFVLIRPPLIYGPGVKANYLKLMQLVQKRLPLPLGSILNKRSMLALDNLVDFILLVSKHPQAANELFLLSDEKSFSTAQLIDQIALSMGFTSSRLIPMPVTALRMIAKCFGQSAAVERLTDSLEVNSQKAQYLLGWEPPLNVEAGIQMTVDDFLLFQKAD
ncbi:MAG: NAD-dependent epimerase/dehydratase family protein [Polynucleobacter sp.]|nr:NAD-dependent epimerase/dehydratase family protein [Polynucleobacter sp.]